MLDYTACCTVPNQIFCYYIKLISSLELYKLLRCNAQFSAEVWPRTEAYLLQGVFVRQIFYHISHWIDKLIQEWQSKETY